MVKRVLRAIRRDEQGATAIEYGLILALVVLVALGGIGALASSTTGLWRDMSDRASNAMQHS